MIRKYNQQYDAYYNADTGEWLESECEDDNCEYCSNRPYEAPIEKTDDT